MSNIFEQSSRMKLKIDTPRGMISIDDLWDLPLSSQRSTTLSLQTVARGISATIKSEVEEDFVGDSANENTIPKLQLDIVKHIIAVKKAENATKESALANKTHNAQIDELIAAKQLDEKKNMSIEDLLKLKK